MRHLFITVLLLGIILSPASACPSPFVMSTQEPFPVPPKGFETGKYALLVKSSVTRFYELEELQLYRISILWSGRLLSLGLQWNSFGWPLYRESVAGLEIRMRFGGVLSLSGGLRYCRRDTEGFESVSCLALDLGCRLGLNDTLLFSVSLRNINEPVAGVHMLNRLGMNISTTLLWRPVERLRFQLQCTGEDGEMRLFFAAAMGFGPIEVMTEAGSNPFAFSAALSVRLGNSAVAVCWRTIPEIGEMARTAAAAVRFHHGKRRARLPEKININTADRLQLAVLPGMSTTRIDSLTEYRKLYGSFRRTVDICRVRGITAKMYSGLADRLAVDDRGRQVLPVREKPRTHFRINSAEIRDCVRAGFTLREALKLIRFRDRLGGFTSIREIRLLPESKGIISRKLERLYVL